MCWTTEVGVHLRRGDKLAMMPGLKAAWVESHGCRVGESLGAWVNRWETDAAIPC